jgi:2-polyprenyl-6-methoxyphenol hydroxylase-like FAD-dependent oxidoreductase
MARVLTKGEEINLMTSKVILKRQSTESLGYEENVLDVRQTTCCVVGGGPAGAVLALLLARKGVNVTLLEAHGDFDRDFRGDSLHPSILEVMDEIGLADRLLDLPHTKVSVLPIQTSTGPFVPLDFRRLKTKFPYIAFMPQTRFLEFVTEEAKRYPNFRLVMRARVKELIEVDGVVRGVRYESKGGLHEVRTLLTVGADGRFSRLRRLGGFEPKEASPPMDVLWFRLPRRPDESRGIVARIARGHIGVLLDRGEQWQAAYVIPKGTYQEMKAAGLEELRGSFARLLPEAADRIEHLVEWKQVSVLSVAADRLPRWYRPGLLLIGDAAHVMSPVAGVGINYAVLDAVVTANLLAGPLKVGRVRLRDLARVQRRREPSTWLVQAFQAQVQRRVVAPALDSDQPFALPLPLRLLLRIPGLRSLPSRLVAFGIGRVHVKD